MIMLCNAQIGIAASADPGPVNCDTAKAADDISICASRDLMAMDGEMDRAYRAARTRWTASISNSIKVAQQEWIEKRRACGANTGCLMDAYVKQIKELDEQRPKDPKWILETIGR